MTELSSSYPANEVAASSAPRSLAEVRASLYETSMRDELLLSVAKSVQYGLDDYLGSDASNEPRVLTEEEFDQLYDDRLPTIVFDSHQMFGGAELLGVVSHELTTRANIIYTSPLTSALTAKVSGDSIHAHLDVDGGAMVLADGQVVYGDFPRSVVADKLITADVKLVEQCEEYSLPVATSSTRMRQISDKMQLDTLSNNQHAYNPRHIARAAFLAATQTDNLVIKPTKHSQGRGVLLTDTNADSQHAKQFYTFLEQYRYEPLVQERARSFEIREPETQERLDWNVRALVSYGDLIGMYVRADHWGGPVNISQSARAIRMDEFSQYFTDPSEATRVIETLETAARAIACDVSDVDIVGLDLTVDESMRACMFEMNGGLSGGLQTMARLETAREDKLAMSRHLLANYLSQTTTDRSQETEGATVQLDPGLDSLMLAAPSTSLRRVIGNLDIHELPINDDERFGRVHALATMHLCAAGALQFERCAEINKILQADYPLELRSYILRMYKDPIHGEAIDSYLETYNTLFPDDLEISVLRVDQLLATVDLPAYRERILQSPQPEELERVHHASFAKQTLLQWFGAMPRQLSDEESDSFIQVLKSTLTSYCHEGYPAAVQNLKEQVNASDTSEVYSQLVYSLQFCLAMGDDRGTDALEMFSSAEEHFSDPWVFYENVVDQFCHLSQGKIEGLSDSRFITRATLDAQLNPPLVVMMDTLDYLRHSSRSTELRTVVADILATHMSLDWDDDSRTALRDVLTDLVNSTDDNASLLCERVYEVTLPVETKVMLLIDRLTRGDNYAAQIILDDLAQEAELENDLDYLRDVYFGGGQEI